jgi:hypothetical protein
VVPGPEHSQGGCAGSRRLDPHIPPGLCLREPKKNVGRRHHAVTASSIPVLGVSQHEGVTPFVKRRRQPSEPAREKLRRQGTAHRRPPRKHRSQRRRNEEARSSASKRSGSSTAAQRTARSATASAAAAPRQRSENPEVQRRAQRQLHGSAAKTRSATARSSRRRRTERKRTRKGQKPKGGSAVSRTKQSKRQNKARRQHSQRGKQKRSEK